MKPHSKDELLTSRVPKGQSRMGPGHDGVPRHHTRPGEPGLIAHPHAVEFVSGQQDHTSEVHGTTPGKVKHAHMVASPIHDGMMGKSRRTGTHFSGLSGQDLSHYDADPGNALSGPEVMGHNLPMGKKLTPVAPAFGQRSRTVSAFGSDGDRDTEEVGAAHARAMAGNYADEMAELSRRIFDEAIDSGRWGRR